MASLTPGILSKLLENATGSVKLSSPPYSSHRSPLLQVIEIVPCLADDQWRSEGFFVKVSDSLHSAYVAVCAGDDADLIRSDDIQLGQLVYVRGGLHVVKGYPVPVIRGLKPVPKRRPCFGNPSDLVSSDVLLPFTQASPMNDKKKKKNTNSSDTRKLSFDSARKGWDQTPSPLRRDAALLSSPRIRNNLVMYDKRASPKNESPSRHLSSDRSTLKNRNGITPPKLIAKSWEDDIKASSKDMVPAPLFKMPVASKTWSDLRILWAGLPSSTQMLGKEVLSHSKVAFSAAVNALEEASATESLLHCLQAFGELCESSLRLSSRQVVEQFLELYHTIQSTSKTLHSFPNLRPPSDAKSSKHSSCHEHNTGLSTSMAKKKATSWVQAAVVSDLAQLSLFKEPAKQKVAADQEHHYIVIEASSEKRNSENSMIRSNKSPRIRADKAIRSPTMMKRCSVSNRKNVDSKSRLKDLENLAEELLVESRQWFLNYLENSLNKGFFSVQREESNNGNASLISHFKRVNHWLDDLIVNRRETEKNINDLRKKLHRSLLEHIKVHA